MRKRKLFTVLILTGIAITLFRMPSDTAYAGTSFSDITSEKIEGMKDQISESEKLQAELENNITNAKKVKKELEQLKNDVSAYITKIDQEIVDLQIKIDEYKELITTKEGEIEVITGELKEAIEVEEAQYAAMKVRIKFMYEHGDSLYLDLLASATSFSDMLAKADYIEKLSAYSQMKLDEYVAVREYTETVKAYLEAEKETLDVAKASLETEEKTLEELLAEKEQELANYKSQIAVKENQINEYEEDLAANTAAIEALEAAVIAEQKAILAANGITLVYDGGQFTWPAPSWVAITDNFGYRTDPINGRTSYHSGLDIGAPGGSPILAAYDGVVVAAAFDSSMGNYVMINHGGGLYTVYMHSRQLLVQKDDIVTRGEKIALVGTTGRSTGNHLHFSVRLNGQYVDPKPYLGMK